MSEQRYGVWITGGHIDHGRWMMDVGCACCLSNRRPWVGSFAAAQDAAADRNRIHGQHGLRYTVKPLPQPEVQES